MSPPSAHSHHEVSQAGISDTFYWRKPWNLEKFSNLTEVTLLKAVRARVGTQVLRTQVSWQDPTPDSATQIWEGNLALDPKAMTARWDQELEEGTSREKVAWHCRGGWRLPALSSSCQWLCCSIALFPYMMAPASPRFYSGGAQWEKECVFLTGCFTGGTFYPVGTKH